MIREMREADSRLPAAAREGAQDRREGADRRRRPTPMLSRYVFVGRRRAPRREEEAEGVYVDRPGGFGYVLLGAVLALSLLDAVFTLAHLDRGGREANPLMDWAIRAGPVVFLAIKIVLTVTGTLLLVLHRYFRGVRPLLVAVLALYVALMGYHAYLATLP